MKQLTKDGLKLLQFDHIDTNTCIHFSTTIQGGVSEGTYTSLNLGLHSGDEISKVEENRKRLIDALGIKPDLFITPFQTHGDNIVVIDTDFLVLNKDQQQGKLHGVDALITNLTGVCISIGTADCVPMILYDAKLKVLATIHAGWRGTVAKIGMKTAQQMIDRFGCNAKDIQVGIGPSICAENFEVGEEVGEAFTLSGYMLDEIAYRHTSTNKLHINLQEANKLQYESIGILTGNIQIANCCTYDNAQDFFSARRQTIHSGRMLTGGYIK